MKPSNETINTYICDQCGGTFVKAWTDEEAAIELKENFGSKHKPEDCLIFCDDCYKLLLLSLS